MTRLQWSIEQEHRQCIPIFLLEYIGGLYLNRVSYSIYSKLIYDIAIDVQNIIPLVHGNSGRKAQYTITLIQGRIKFFAVCRMKDGDIAA